jgi:hypothetical protein
MIIGEGSTETRRGASLSQLGHPCRVDLSLGHAHSNKLIIRKDNPSLYTTKAVNLDNNHGIEGEQGVQNE